MIKYSIKDLEQITGIKAHTIRIWERRYGIVDPMRTETNIRFYTDSDLKKLLNISMLNAAGIKISHLANLSRTDLEAKVIEFSRGNKLENISIEKLILATINFDEDLFENTLSKSIIDSGMESTIFYTLFPFFERVGVLWQVGSINPAQEHFISNLIRQKLFVAIDSFSAAKTEGARKVLFYLKENELHEISILFYNYLAKKNGYQTLYLGQNLTFNDLINTKEFYQPDFIVTSFIASITSEKLNEYLLNLKKIKGTQVVITGMQLKSEGLKIPKSLKVITSPKDFTSLLNK
jgi:DNA-binding transcriptional MerR regulator